MTTFQWVQVVQSVVMLVATVAIWIVGRGLLLAVSTAVIETRLTAVEHRMEQAGRKTSDLASRVQVVLIHVGVTDRLEQRVEDVRGKVTQLESAVAQQGAQLGMLMRGGV